ncbi:hypothetical protein ACH4UM_41410, partial [Streptomyces sp. NPDC020801]
AAQNQQTDSALVSQLTSAESQIPDYPRVNLSDTSTVLTSAQAATADAAGTDIIALSYDPTAQIHNVENINLEPVWPFGQIGDDPAGSNTITNLAKRTFDHRPFTDAEVWSFDAMDAARLGRASDFESNTKTLTTNLQSLINGMSQYNTAYEGDLEQSATVAASTNEALVQSYDGTVRIAPAWPSDWNVDGSVYILGGAKVDVQVRSGVPSTVGIEAKTSTTYTVRSPWPGQQVQVINAGTGAVVVAPTSAATLTVPVTAGTNYLIEQTAAPTSSLTYQAVTGTPATTARTIGTGSSQISIGLTPSNNIVDDTDSGITYTGSSWSAQSGLGSNYFNGTQNVATTNGDSFTYTFTGTGVDFITAEASNRGHVHVSIDGGADQTFNCSSTTTAYQQACASVRDLAYGSHTIKVTKVDGSYMTLDGLKVTNDMVDDTGNIDYSGSSWSAQSGLGSNYFNGTQYVATTNGDSFTYTFTGTGVDFITAEASNRGHVHVSIDGGADQTFDCSSTTVKYQQACASVRDLAYGSHTIKVTKVDGTYMTLDALKVTNDMVDDTAGNIAYTGSSWSAQSGLSSSNYFNGTQYVATTNGDSFSYTFTGTGVDFITAEYSNRGHVHVSIDGGADQTFDCSATTAAYQQACASVRGLTSGSHTIKVTKVDGTYMTLDALKVIS